MRCWLPLFLTALRIHAAEPAPAAAEPVDLRLPTENRYLFEGQPEKFYMWVDRTFEGVATKPWEGGSFGFVRTPVKVNGKVVLRQFHEGIDIAPVKRDKAGNPLDLVSSIADGMVVHTSPVAGRSNYGKYVVVAHDWDGSKVFSLYAHLADITCKPGDPVKAGGLLGRMGYTGAGINRTRAHVHLELALMLSSRYDDWGSATGKGINHHGNYNGMNLAGADVAGYFLARQKTPGLRFSEFVTSTPVYFKVAVPASPTPDLLTRYPWLKQASAASQQPADSPASWEISFSATGLPTRITPSLRKVEAPVITQVRPSDIPHRFLTRYLVNGEGSTATLSNGALELVNLLTGSFPAQPPAPAPPAKPEHPASAAR